MAKLTINRGSTANDGSGDNLRVGAGKVNDNFTELYTAFGDGSTLTTGTFITTSSSSVLSNKTIALGSNTVSGTLTQFNTALTGASFATLAGSEVLTNKSIDSDNNTITNIVNADIKSSAAIANSKLANSTIAIGGVTFNLGDTDATPALNLTDATNYPTSSLTGTITNTQLAGSITAAKLAGSIGDSKLSTITTADKVSAAAVQVDGATDGTGITLATTDKLIVDDAGTTKYINASQLNTYMTGQGFVTDDPTALAIALG